jgi:hypothetical protein
MCLNFYSGCRISSRFAWDKNNNKRTKKTKMNWSSGKQSLTKHLSNTETYPPY